MVFKFSSRNTLFFIELYFQKRRSTSKQEPYVTHSSTSSLQPHCLLQEHGPSVAKCPGTGKGTGSYDLHTELPLHTWKHSLKSQGKWGWVRGRKGSFPFLSLPLELCSRNGMQVHTLTLPWCPPIFSSQFWVQVCAAVPLEPSAEMRLKIRVALWAQG